MALKGFFFSLDVVFSIVIALIIIFAFYYHLLRAGEDPLSTTYLSKVANDAIIVLDKNSTLQTLDNKTIERALAAVLPKVFAYKLNLTVYECADSNCNSFKVVPEKNVYVAKDTATKDSISARRFFITFESQRVRYFSIADLQVWLK